MKHEYVHRNRLCIDIDKDAKMAKHFENMILTHTFSNIHTEKKK